MSATVLEFKRPETNEQPHCNCVIAPPPAEPPRRIWTNDGWACSECRCILERKDLVEE